MLKGSLPHEYPAVGQEQPKRLDIAAETWPSTKTLNASDSGITKHDCLVKRAPAYGALVEQAQQQDVIDVALAGEPLQPALK